MSIKVIKEKNVARPRKHIAETTLGIDKVYNDCNFAVAKPLFSVCGTGSWNSC